MFPSNALQAKRWARCLNTSDETIPPHAILRLVDLGEDGGKRNRFFNQQMHGDQVVWRVGKPSAESLAAMDGAMFVVNGPQSILPGKFGVCSRDWPLPVLHDGSEDDLPNGAPCGPMADQWWVASSGFCFTCISHDIAGRSGKGDIHTAWIAPSNHEARKCGAVFGSAALASGAAMPLSHARQMLGLALNESHSALVVDLNGLYSAAFAGTLTAPQAPRGATLTLKLFLDDIDTGYAVSRAQDIELDAYGAEVLTTRENVAAPQCLIDADKDQAVSVRNASAYDVSVTNFWLTAVRLGPRSDAFGAVAGGLVFP